MSVFLIPTVAEPQQFLVVLGALQYSMTLQYADVDEGGWLMTIADGDGNLIMSGVAMITGANLLGPFGYLGIGEDQSLLYVYTDGEAELVPPTFANMGTEGNLYYEVPDGA